jgi:tRNA pseudouridine55 synthase
LVDKPAGLTSHDVVQRIRRVLRTRSVGHTGTLDPFATGLLIVLVGRATRLARFVESQPKTYLATAQLGVRTDTDDLTGRAAGVTTGADAVPAASVQEALQAFRGTHLQRPPQYSAKHVEGQRSYRRARRGEVVELPESSVIVYQIELLEYRLPHVTFRAVVSAGTYLRAIARDLGERLGVGAHLTALRREAIGSLRVEDSVPLEQIGPNSVVPAQVVLGDMPIRHLDAAARRAVSHGRAVADSGEMGKRGSGEAVALLQGGQLVAVARARDGWLQPTIVLDVP